MSGPCQGAGLMSRDKHTRQHREAAQGTGGLEAAQGGTASPPLSHSWILEAT